MAHKLFITLATFLVILSGMAEIARSEQLSSDPFMAKAGFTTRPIGHHEFCKRNRSECRVKSRKAPRVHLTNARWAQLINVNETVNRRVTPMTDFEIFGREEVWVYPTDIGDCEDFVLLKRRELIKKGWPVGALLITVVRQTNGEGHAVLSVLTDRGDLILDNLDSQVKVWSETEYHYVKRQSEVDSGRWVAVDDARTSSVGSLSR